MCPDAIVPFHRLLKICLSGWEVELAAVVIFEIANLTTIERIIVSWSFTIFRALSHTTVLILKHRAAFAAGGEGAERCASQLKQLVAHFECWRLCPTELREVVAHNFGLRPLIDFRSFRSCLGSDLPFAFR